MVLSLNCVFSFRAKVSLNSLGLLNPAACCCALVIFVVPLAIFIRLYCCC
uniref:Uncharacterized protein n=1 Tax=uncultured marine virus TaxID=186617 RepID=A0A0F7L5Y4_9VIRU|nr:hypothetical protein [uncultured marine virus]